MLLVLSVGLLAAGGILVSRGLDDDPEPVANAPAPTSSTSTSATTSTSTSTSTSTTAPATTSTTRPEEPVPSTAPPPPPPEPRPPGFVFPNGTTIEPALVREMALIRDFSYLEGILGDYGIGVRVTETTGDTGGRGPVVQALFPPEASFDARGRMRVSRALRGSTVEIVVVRRG